MMDLKYKTRGMSTTQGKAKVFFASHDNDFEQYFTSISNEILACNDCSIWYVASIEAAVPKNLVDVLGEMQLIVIPITSVLLLNSNSVIDFIVPFALENHIPLLPIMQETGLTSFYSEIFGNIQYLDKNIADSTSIEYEKKLKQYLSSVLINDEMADKIRSAFDAYIFLSYRKKDRKHAQELMRLIHENDFCRDIAIWYDEFLVPGEDFTDAIEQALNKCELFTLVVTPNLVNEPNYVRDVEYPLARQGKKRVLPVELVSTDHDALQSGYENIPPCATTDSKLLREALLHNIVHIAQKRSDSPEHNFFIGLAYLEGVDLEVNFSKAVSLITYSAEHELPEAMQKLATMYHVGQGLARDTMAAIYWQEKYVQSLAKKTENTTRNYEQYATARFELASLWAEIDKYDNAIDVINILVDNKETSNDPLYRIIQNGANLAIGRLYDKKKQFVNAKQRYKAVFLSYEKMRINCLTEDDYVVWIQSCLALSNKSTDGHIYAIKALELSKVHNVPIGTKCHIWKAVCNLSKPFSMQVSKVFAEMIVKSCEELAAESGFSRNIQLELAMAYRLLGSCYGGLDITEPDNLDKKKIAYTKAIDILEELISKYEIVDDTRSIIIVYQEFALSCQDESIKRELIEKCLKYANSITCVEQYNDVINAVRTAITTLTGILIRSREDTMLDSYVSMYENYTNLLIKRGDTNARHTLIVLYSSMVELYIQNGDVARSKIYLNRKDLLCKSFDLRTEGKRIPSRNDVSQSAGIYVSDFSAKDSAIYYEKLAKIAIERIKESTNLNKSLELARIYEHLSAMLDKNGNVLRSMICYMKAMILKKKAFSFTRIKKDTINFHVTMLELEIDTE